MAINKLDTGAIQDNAITNAKMADDAVGVADLAATGTPSSTTFLRGDNAWVTPTDTDTVYTHPNHSGDVVSAADGAMTIQTDAVDIAMLSATGTPGNTTFLRGDNAWATAGSTSASDLTSGTLPMARLSGTLPALNGSALTNLPSDVTVSTSAPSSPATGDLWFNSTSGINLLYVWDSTIWSKVSNIPFSATGGTITTDGIYKVHTFLSSGTFTTTVDGTVDVFLVGGGGCGGVDIGGGGGAGGVLTSTSRSLSAGSHSIVVGAGAPTHSGGEGGNNNYDKGTNSTGFSLTALAGGAGGQEYAGKRDGDSGGSGGGAGYSTANGGAGTSGQGFAGGNSVSGACGGGGGQSEVGASGTSQTGPGGDGGDGIQNTWSGTHYYAGGGGGTTYQGSVAGDGGAGGGGGAGGVGTGGTGDTGTGGVGRNAGGNGAAHVGGNGGANTGGGGGGGSEGNSSTSATGGAGGSGIVIVRYLP